MTRNVLMVCTTASMIGNFNLGNIRTLQKLGYKVSVACNFCNGSNWSQKNSVKLKHYLESNDVKCYQVDFARSPFNLKKDILEYKELLTVIKNNNFDFVHCHTPMGGVITRIITSKLSIPVIYTAHGFHFFKGAPRKNWLFYYPIEKWLSKKTNILITINDEDYKLAQNKMYASKVFEIPGAGVNVNKFKRNLKSRMEIRKELKISPGQVMILSVGELNDNKNHRIVLEALSKIKNENFIYVIAGVGKNKKALENDAKKLGISNKLKLIGYRNDIEKIYSAADIFVFPSKREGLSFAGIEAISASLPVVGSNIRGVRDYITDKISGYLVSPDNATKFAKYIKLLINNPELREKMGEHNSNSACIYDEKNVQQKMKEIYETEISEN